MENKDNPGPVGSKSKSPGNNPVQAGAIGNNYAGDYSFRCGDLMNGCDWHTSGDSEDEIRRHVEQHGRDDHGMSEVGDDTWDKVRSFVRRRPEQDREAA